MVEQALIRIEHHVAITTSKPRLTLTVINVCNLRKNNGNEKEIKLKSVILVQKEGAFFTF